MNDWNDWNAWDRRELNINETPVKSKTRTKTQNKNRRSVRHTKRATKRATPGKKRLSHRKHRHLRRIFPAMAGIILALSLIIALSLWIRRGEPTEDTPDYISNSDSAEETTANAEDLADTDETSDTDTAPRSLFPEQESLAGMNFSEQDNSAATDASEKSDSAGDNLTEEANPAGADSSGEMDSHNGLNEENPPEEVNPVATDSSENNFNEENPPEENYDENIEKPGVYFPMQRTAETIQLGEDFSSAYAVAIHVQTGNIIAEKNADVRMFPASMTKILTILVAAERIPDISAPYTVTEEATHYSYVNGCSIAGFKVGETVPIIDLFYGTILPSGADAAVALAICTAGSLEEFIVLLNEKLAELGLSQSAHFTNCVGIYDENHYCTVTDMAIILRAAMQNSLCRQVLSRHTYSTTPTEQNPGSLSFSNWFLRRIEDHDTELTVRAVGAKTGYVAKAGNCAASWAESKDGSAYLCVTGNTFSLWRAIFDHVELYKLCQ